MALDLYGPGARPPLTGGVVLGRPVRQWVEVMAFGPVAIGVLLACLALGGVPQLLIWLSALGGVSVLWVALWLRSGVTSTVVSPACITQQNRRGTKAMRPDEVTDLYKRLLTTHSVVVISAGKRQIMLNLSTVNSDPRAREALETFLARAGVAPFARAGAGDVALSRAGRARRAPDGAEMPWPTAGPSAGNGASPAAPLRPLSLRTKGRVLYWVTFGALALAGLLAILRIFT